jgi:hypothetical protein
MTNLGAFTLGMLHKKCVQGEAEVQRDGPMHVTYSWSRSASGMGPRMHQSIYYVSVTADTNVMGVADPSRVNRIAIQEEVRRGDDESVAASVVANRENNGWYVSSIEPVGEDSASGYESSTEVIGVLGVLGVQKLGLGILKDALQRDVIGDQQ